MAAAKKEKEKNGLMHQKNGTLSKQRRLITIGALEAALLKKYPATDSEEWDRTGLLVGDPAALVKGVALALDPTVEAIRETRRIEANVLITHHPAFIASPGSFAPADSVSENPGAGVWAAIENNVALMSFHTALDVSQDASRVLPGMLGLVLKGIVDPIEGSRSKGYGQLCTVRPSESDLTVEQLAARCTSVFGRQPRVWGSFDRKPSRIVTCTGSAGDVVGKALAMHADCLVCGEIRYHDALNAVQAGMAVIDLGHDTSELPLVTVLAAAAESIVQDKERVTVLDQDSNWTYPEAVRV